VKPIRKFNWLVLFVLVVGMVLTACGGEDATSTPEPAAPEATTAPEPTEPPAPTKEPVEAFECTDEFGCATVAQGENLRIATALVISGPNESLGIDAQRGVEIAIDDKQEIFGFPIELVAEDGGCSAEGGQTAATKITSDETIVGVIGHNCSSSCTPAAPIYDQAGFTMISPSCTAPALTGADTHVASFLRTCHNDKVQGAIAAEFFYNELGLRTAATIHDGSPYAEQLQQVFADTFSALGGTITAQEAVNVGDTDMRPLLTSIAVDQPELIYYPIFVAEGGFITAQAREVAGLEDTILSGADGMISPDFLDAAGDAGEGMYITGPNLDFENPLGVAFAEEHLAKYGEEPISAFHAHAWDAAMILFDAIEEVGVLDQDGNLHIGRKALRDAVYGTTGFEGITGTLTCDENGDCADPSITINQIQNGEYVAIWNDKLGYVGEAAAPTEPTEPGEAKTVTITFFEEPDTMNPYYTGMWFTTLTYDFWLTPLWFFDDGLQAVPEIAAEIPSVENGGLSEDGLVVTIKLREDAEWSDGTPLTADDYVFTYDMIMADGNAVQTRYPFDTFVESVTALDDKTVEISMTEPYAAWAIGLNLWLLPKHVLEPVFEAEGTIDTADWNRNPTVGVGPFVLKEWSAASHLIFEANDNYWRGRPNLDQIFIRIVPDDEAQMAAISAGDTDIGVYMTGANKPDIDAIDGVELVAPGGGGWAESWFFNLISEELAAENDLEPGHPALQDKRVRQAIVMGLDRQQIIDELFYGVYIVPASLWYDTAYENPDVQPWPYDPEAAMALLDEAGWVDSNGDGTRDKDGVELVLTYSTTAGNELREATQVVAQQMLADIGVGIEIENQSYDVIWNGYGDGGPIALGQYDIAEWSTQTWDYPDPNTGDWLCDEIPSTDNPAGGNWQGVCIEELEELFQQQAVTADTAARIEMYHRIQEIMHDEMFFMGVRSDPDMWALNTRVKNVRFSTASPFWNSFEWDVE
jgi:ABC-type transport system substrate-binding protein/ABC-type branched-subunit amino acid transport system substrate-binding protein